MRPLRVALVHRTSPRVMESRMVGWWSHPVPEFTWDHYPVGKGFTLDKDALAESYDLIFYEDAKIWGRFAGSAGIPVVYLVVDSTLSEEHYQHRLREARQADLVLVDWDRLDRFPGPVARWSYCVNPTLFRDYGLEREIDIGSFQGGTKERADLEAYVAGYCESRGLRFERGRYGGAEYARMMARCKVVLNWNRNPETRGHRVFDAMGCGACLVTNPVPEVSGEKREAGRDYVEFGSLDDLPGVLDDLFLGAHWSRYARNGYRLVHQWHTWAVRAVRLWQILQESGLCDTSTQA